MEGRKSAITTKGNYKMAKLTKKQKKMQEMLEGFTQPSTAVDAIKKLKEI